MLIKISSLGVTKNHHKKQSKQLLSLLLSSRAPILWTAFNERSKMLSTAAIGTDSLLPARKERGRQLVAICQLNSQHSLEENAHVCTKLIARAANRGAKMVFLPECFDFVARTNAESLTMGLHEDGPFIHQFRELAKRNNIWLSLGGFHNLSGISSTSNPKQENSQSGGTDEKPKPYNTHLLIDAQGQTHAFYNKLHLFDLDLPGRVRLMESEAYRPGDNLVPPVDTPIGRLAMSICYDARFPELSLYNRYRGADILSFPSSFTLNTGLAHWETLLRCRAIENQCYVVAAAQTGRHNDKRISYGHSMVVDPWGTVVAQCSDRADICFAEIDLDYVDEVRTNQPVFAHRRSDLYSLVFNEQVENTDVLMFGSKKIHPAFIFYRSGLSYAFVNLKPVLPGHVLCSPVRQALRLNDLTDEETADLFIVARKVQRVVERHHGLNSSTVCVQDGENAGRTIPHVHAHIVPRSCTDFDGELDKFYSALGSHDRIAKPRSEEEMAAEASIYRDMLLAEKR